MECKSLVGTVGGDMHLGGESPMMDTPVGMHSTVVSEDMKLYRFRLYRGYAPVIYYKFT